MLDQTTDILVQATAFFTFNVAIVTLLDVSTSKLFVWPLHQLVFNCGLDLIDIHLVAALHLLADNRSNSGAINGIIDFRCFSCTQNRFFEAL